MIIPQKTGFIAKNAITREKKSLHLRRQMRVLHSEWLQCSSNLSGLAQLGPIFGNMILPLHIAHSGHCKLHSAQCTLHTVWREVTNIRSMSQRQYRIREWLSESTHILIGLFTNNTACDTCLPLSPVDITTWKLKPIADEKIEKKKSFMFPHL